MEQQKASVFVVVLTLSERDGWCSPQLMTFLTAAKAAAVTGNRDVEVTFQHNVRPFDHARNLAARAFLKSGCDWLLMIDNDMAPPSNLLEMLDRTGDHMDVVVPKFYSLGDAGIRLCWRLPEEPLSLNEQCAEWIQLSAAGSGCMFVRRRVCESLQNPYFRFIYDDKGVQIVTEDFGFCIKASAAGFKIWGNSQYEVDHFKTVSLSALARLIDPLSSESLRYGPLEMAITSRAKWIRGSPNGGKEFE
jgi:hypothetical protein